VVGVRRVENWELREALLCCGIRRCVLLEDVHLLLTVGDGMDVLGG
jgi:hypothetical protein